jgi:hypothetical protein
MTLKSTLAILTLPLLAAAGITHVMPPVSAATRLIPISEILNSQLPGAEAERELARTIADFEGRTVEQVQARVRFSMCCQQVWPK